MPPRRSRDPDAPGVAAGVPIDLPAQQVHRVVEVAQSYGNSEALIGATVFEPGRQYLVATDGQALVRGYSGMATPELQALYDAAF